jgi:DNA polymerase-3 subunit delta
MSPADEVVPVYLVRGDDPALVGPAVSELVRRLAGDDSTGLAVEDLSGDDVGLDAAVDAVQTPAFLSDRRVVVVRDVGRFRTDDLDSLLAYLDDPLPTSVLVLVGGGGQVAAKLLAAVKKAGHVVDVTVPSGAKGRSGWLAAQLKQAPVKLDREAAGLLGDHLGEDLGRLATLLDALASAYGEAAVVSADELQPFLGEAGGVAPWALTDAIDAGDTEGALVALKRLTEAGDRHPLVILASLHRHYGAMLRLDGAGVHDENQAAALIGSGPYPAKKAMNQAKRLGPAGVARAITLLSDADIDLRGGRAWPEPLILEVLIARLSRLGPRRR